MLSRRFLSYNFYSIVWGFIRLGKISLYVKRSQIRSFFLSGQEKLLIWTLFKQLVLLFFFFFPQVLVGHLSYILLSTQLLLIILFIATQPAFTCSNLTIETLTIKLTIKIPERRQWRRSKCQCIFIVNFEHNLHFVLVFLLLTLNT